MRVNDERRVKLMLPQELQLLKINLSGICPQRAQTGKAAGH